MPRSAGSGTLAVFAVLLLCGSLVAAQSDLDALARARREVSARPDDPEALLALGRLEAGLGLTGQALATLSRVSAVEPGRAEPYLLGAVLLRDSGQYDAAVAVLEKGVSAGAADVRIDQTLAQLFLAKGDVESALTAARRGLVSAPGSEGLIMVEGLALALDPERRSEAIERLGEALALAKEGPATAYLELGRLLVEEGRSDEAIPPLRRAIEGNPQSAEAYYRLGTALGQTGDSSGSRSALERSQQLTREQDAAERRAKELGTGMNEVEALLQTNALDAARRSLEDLLAEYPEEAALHAMMAKIMFAMRLPQAGLASAQRARELDPQSVEARYLVGLFLANMGRMEDAREVLNEALALAPNAEPVVQLLRQMDEAESGD